MTPRELAEYLLWLLGQGDNEEGENNNSSEYERKVKIMETALKDKVVIK